MDVALREARNRLGGLIGEVEKGGEVTITRRGKAVARLTPAADSFDRTRVAKAIDGLLEIRKGASLGGLSVRELKNEGRP